MRDFILVLKKKKNPIVKLSFDSIDEISIFLKYFFGSLDLKESGKFSYLIYRKERLFHYE